VGARLTRAARLVQRIGHSCSWRSVGCVTPSEKPDDPRQGLHPADTDLVLYGVTGFDRGGMSARSGVGSGRGRQRRVIQLSESLTFSGPDGGTVTVTSQHRGDQKRLEEIRSSAPINPYLASPRGRAAHAAWNRVDPIPRPADVEWTTTTISVDGAGAPFELCDLGEGYWAAVGLVPDATITIDGRMVPVGAVALERLASREPPPPTAPDLGDRGDAVLSSLEDRFAQVPFGRVRHWADYWALRDVEIDHVRLLGRREGLSEQQLDAVESYWLRRIHAALSETLERLRSGHRRGTRRGPMGRRIGSGVLFQIWFNTVGSGGRTWFGNRYTTIRHYTFRFRWRP
jgi:hypothetical protein